MLLSNVSHRLIASVRHRFKYRFSRNYRQLQAFATTRRSLVVAPFDLELYRHGISTLYDAGFHFPKFSSTESPGCRTDVYFRHDIDLELCPHRLMDMIEIERRFGISSGVFFQANDQAPYVLTELRDLVSELLSKQVEIGLHSVCYTTPDPWRALENEIARFSIALGMRPRTFNVHGLGTTMLQERTKFYKEVTATKLCELKFNYCDLSAAHRRYDYVVQDCHISAAAQGIALLPNSPPPPISIRFLKDDFGSLPKISGMRYLMLTHPGYWQAL